MGPSGSLGVGAAEDTRALHERIQQLEQELERHQQDLQKIIFGISHDIREPLRQVLTNADSLEGSHNKGEESEHVAAIRTGVKRIESIISGLQAYAEAGEARPDLSGPLEAAIALDLALLNLDGLIRETKAEIIRGPLPSVEGRDSQVTLLFQHLIDNAIRYRGERSPRIRVSAERRDVEWRFAVEDNGAGIDAQHHDRVFDLFRRLHGRERSGAGLGLAVCRRIVESHGGRIWVESEPEHGSTFFFTLPAQD